MACVFEKTYIVPDPKSPETVYQLTCVTHNCVMGVGAEPPASGKCPIQQQEDMKASKAKD